MTKPTTTYTAITKNTTSYIGSSAGVSGVALDSSTVTLNSLTVYLHGYTTDPPPNQTSTKPLTTYTEV